MLEQQHPPAQLAQLLALVAGQTVAVTALDLRLLHPQRSDSRDTPRSAARSRLDGSRVPGASLPVRTASRSAACSERPRVRAGAAAAGRSSSQAGEPGSGLPARSASGSRGRLVSDDVMEMDLKRDRSAA